MARQRSKTWHLGPIELAAQEMYCGSLSSIYKARRGRQVFAARVFLRRPSIADSDRLLRLFQRGADQHYKLSSGSDTALIRAETGPLSHEGHWYQLVEYAPRGSLAEVIDPPEVHPVARVALWGSYILRGLHELHLAGLAHRSVEPRHLLLTGPKADEPIVKLTGIGNMRPFGKGDSARFSERLEDLVGAARVLAALLLRHEVDRRMSSGAVVGAINSTLMDQLQLERGQQLPSPDKEIVTIIEKILESRRTDLLGLSNELSELAQSNGRPGSTSLSRRERGADEDSQFEWDIFISYPGNLLDQALELYACLSPQCRVFIDRTLKSHNNWYGAVPDAQQRSKVTVVLVSQGDPSDGDTSRPWFRDEIIAAVKLSNGGHAHHCLVPLWLKAKPTGSEIAPYGLNALSGIDVPKVGGLQKAAKLLLEEIPRDGLLAQRA